MKDLVYKLIGILIISLLVFGVITFEIWRWHTFQDVTHSNISFWKWMLLFGGKK